MPPPMYQIGLVSCESSYQVELMMLWLVGVSV